MRHEVNDKQLITDPDAVVRDRLTDWLRRAVDEFGKNDLALLATDVSEWSCAFRLGVYLGGQIDTGWHLDMEYNRQGPGGDPKRIHQLNGRVRTIRPDLLIHRRTSGLLPDNLLHLEIKKEWRGNGDEDDLRKAEASSDGRQEFQYQFAAVLGLCVGGTGEQYFAPTWRLRGAGCGWYMSDGERLLGAPHGGQS